MRFTIGMTLLAGLLVAADQPPKGDVKKELGQFQGSWTVVSAFKDGKADDGLKGAKLVFKGDQFTRTAKGETTKGTVKLNPAAKPKALDGTFADGPMKGQTFAGIYALEGDALKICTSPAGKERPKEFTSKAGSGNLLVALKRDTPVTKKPAAKAPEAKAPTPAPKAPAFSFPDKNLEAAVRASLHEPSAPLTEEKLNNLYFLEAPNKGIANLAGLEKCKNLALIKLTKNQVADLKPLAGLTNLQSLDLKENKVADLAPLAGLTKLQYVELSDNQVADLKPLGGLTNLQSLYLTNNKVSDLAPLGGLVKLSSLSVGHNKVKDIGVLAKVTRLLTLDLNDNQIEDLAPVTKQTELSMLLLERNKVKDLAVLIPWAKADADGPKRFAPYLRIYLKGNPLSEAAKTTQTATLKGFGFRFE